MCPHKIIFMSLFTFQTPSAATSTQEVTLILNEDRITVPYAEVEGMTIKQAFEQFGTSLGAVNRISRYLSAGQIMTGNTKITPNASYSGTVASEAKG